MYLNCGFFKAVSTKLMFECHIGLACLLLKWEFSILSLHSLCKSLPDPGGAAGVRPPLNGTQFFCFRTCFLIHFRQKVPTSEESAPQQSTTVNAPTDSCSHV